MPNYTLYYFNGRGRAEICRMLFAAGGVQYNDKRIEFSEWERCRNDFPCMRLPCLEMDGGTKMPEMMSISRYLSREFGFYPNNNMDMFRCDYICDCFYEMFDDYMRYFHWKNGRFRFGNGGMMGSEMQSRGDTMGSDMQRRGDMMGSQMQSRGDTMGSEMQSRGDTMGSEMQSRGDTMGSQMQSRGDTMGSEMQSRGDTMGSQMQSRGDTMGSQMQSRGDTMGSEMQSRGDTMGSQMQSRGDMMGSDMQSRGDAMGSEMQSRGDTMDCNYDNYMQWRYMNSFNRIMPFLEKTLCMRNSGSHFFMGEQMMWCDMLCYSFMETFMMENQPMFSSYPKMMAMYSRVAAHPKISSYLKSRRNTNW